MMTDDEHRLSPHPACLPVCAQRSGGKRIADMLEALIGLVYIKAQQMHAGNMPALRLAAGLEAAARWGAHHLTQLPPRHI